MHKFSQNVLPLADPPSQNLYRAAVSAVIRKCKEKYRLSNVGLADKIGICDETVSNAENGKGDLNAVTLLRIAYEFGEDAIDPIRNLYLCRLAEPVTLADQVQEALDKLVTIQRELDNQNVRLAVAS